ncbi:hypothetical protein ABT274_12070 [Streptomyces sp. NPDC001127]|uniref:hypothetical protein n=1 Tax=Streptomyces sp. NPDC001127 TaxID=3154377 RepID=UPI00332E81EF
MDALFKQLTTEQESPQNLVDAYLFAKRTLAEAMQELLRSQLPASTADTFSELRDQLGRLISQRYADAIPEKYLKVPYGSRTHEELFSVLLQRRGEPVEASVLRIITADSVHTERRMRELRELGLDIQAAKAQGVDVYTLRSLELDPGMIPSIVRNLIRQDKRLSKPAQDELISLL